MVPLQAAKSALALIHADYTTGDPENYFVPIVLIGGDEAKERAQQHPESVIAQVQSAGGRNSILLDATADEGASTALLETITKRKRLHGEHGTLLASHSRRFRQLWGASHPDLTPALLPSAEINTSVKFGDRFVLKVLRHIQTGPHPGVEMGKYLTTDPNRALPFVAPFAGDMVYFPVDSSEPTTVALLHGYVANEGSMWEFTHRAITTYLDQVRSRPELKIPVEEQSPSNFYVLNFALQDSPPLAKELIGPFLDLASMTGERLARLHAALVAPTNDPVFSPEVFNDFYRQGLYHGYLGLVGRRLEFLRQRLSAMDEGVRALATEVLELEPAILDKFKSIFVERISSVRTRFHGRLHLGHILLREGNITFFDFEGDPTAFLSERRIKRCPLRDVASMLASFGYAAQTAIQNFLASTGGEAMTANDVRVFVRFWYSQVSAAFIRGYWNAAEKAPYMPASQADGETLLSVYLLERAMLDIRPDIEDKPEFAGMPFRLILHLLNKDQRQPASH